MIRHIGFALLPVLIGLTGCLDQQTSTSLVPDGSLASVNQPVTAQHVAYAKITGETATHVNEIGQKVLLANPEIGVKPLIHTFGDDRLEVFHRGTSEIGITVGLVRACKSDQELAAVIAHELGKMVSEREARLAHRNQRAERQPPADLRVGNDNRGFNGDTDMTRMAELAAYEKDRQNVHVPPPPPPDPKALARLYLIKAGLPASELEAVEPLLGTAAQNGALEKQFNNADTARPWTP
ncbi:MAG: M48 family metalloprotease [Gemmataceae bacterium]